MPRHIAHRIIVAILVPLFVCAGSGRVALAETSTGVTIEIVDEGTLNVAWGDGATTFLVDGEAPTLTASTPSITATATLDLVIRDTRADGNRSGYTISLAASGFAAGNDVTIATSQLTVMGVSGAPDGVAVATAIGQSLDSPVHLVTVVPDAPAIDATLSITVAMTIYAGTPPGDYTGSFSFDVQPLVAP